MLSNLLAKIKHDNRAKKAVSMLRHSLTNFNEKNATAYISLVDFMFECVAGKLFDSKLKEVTIKLPPTNLIKMESAFMCAYVWKYHVMRDRRNNLDKVARCFFIDGWLVYKSSDLADDVLPRESIAQRFETIKQYARQRDEMLYSSMATTTSSRMISETLMFHFPMTSDIESSFNQLIRYEVKDDVLATLFDTIRFASEAMYEQVMAE
jgi:hypothetical protein